MPPPPELPPEIASLIVERLIECRPTLRWGFEALCWHTINRKALRALASLRLTSRWWRSITTGLFFRYISISVSTKPRVPDVFLKHCRHYVSLVEALDIRLLRDSGQVVQQRWPIPVNLLQLMKLLPNIRCLALRLCPDVRRAHDFHELSNIVLSQPWSLRHLTLDDYAATIDSGGGGLDVKAWIEKWRASMESIEIVDSAVDSAFLTALFGCSSLRHLAFHSPFFDSWPPAPQVKFSLHSLHVDAYDSGPGFNSVFAAIIDHSIESLVDIKVSDACVCELLPTTAAYMPALETIESHWCSLDCVERIIYAAPRVRISRVDEVIARLSGSYSMKNLPLLSHQRLARSPTAPKTFEGGLPTAHPTSSAAVPFTLQRSITLWDAQMAALGTVVYWTERRKSVPSGSEGT